MSLQTAHGPHGKAAAHKSVVEHGACFGLAIGVLMVAAVAIQWLLHLVP
ncbi:MAG TPA: hypothetical protein VF459_17325 [Caulobacteraceae bacterium]